MKKLTFTIASAFAFIILLASRSKDSGSAVTGQSQPASNLEKVIVSGTVVDITLFTISSLAPSSSFQLSINGRRIEDFRIEGTVNKEWRSVHLNYGTNRINIHVESSALTASGYCSFRFNISDGLGIHSVTAGKVSDLDYAFDLVSDK